MYSIYHTEAIVLGSYDRGETSRVFALLSPDLGLVYGHAQGIRNSKSKLRSHLQHYSHIDVNLVRGKRGWRITQAITRTKRGNIFLYIESIRTFARIAKLLTRLHGGEEANPDLFALVREGHQYIIESFHDDLEKLHTLEVAFVARILMLLGYWGDEYSDAPTCCTKSLLASIDDVVLGKPLFIGYINKALHESHM